METVTIFQKKHCNVYFKINCLFFNWKFPRRRAMDPVTNCSVCVLQNKEIIQQTNKHNEHCKSWWPQYELPPRWKPHIFSESTNDNGHRFSPTSDYLCLVRSLTSSRFIERHRFTRDLAANDTKTVSLWWVVDELHCFLWVTHFFLR